MIRHLTELVFILFTFAMTSCSPQAIASPTPTPNPFPGHVGWNTAVDIIHSGQVEMVVQLHSLDVTLILKDGTEIHKVEPTIDAVFQEIDKCGLPCSEIIMATE